MSMSTHGKAIVAFLYAVAVAALPQLTGDRQVDPAEGVAIAIAVATAAATYLVPLAPSLPAIKTLVAALLAALQVTATVILDGALDSNDVLLIAATALGALGIAVAPAESRTGVAVGWGSDSRTA
jgi:hypothetical protein